MASEEMDDPLPIPAMYPKGKYLILFDPHDGSSNIDMNVAVGTIFSILRAPEGCTEPKLEDYLQPSTKQVCAGYTTYGPTTMFVLTSGHGLNGFTLDRSIGEFILTHSDMTIPADTQEFAINISNQRFWDAPIKRYVDECLAGKEGARRKDFNMRWMASMVAEVHRILTRGGIFMYPMDGELKPKGQAGKLRLMYEANPMGYIVEQVGGACSTGAECIMEIEPSDLHQRVPVVLGLKNGLNGESCG